LTKRNKIPFDSSFDIELVSDETNGMTGSEINELMRRINLLAIGRNDTNPQISMNDFYECKAEMIGSHLSDD
jgi:hypothetical protein